MRQGSSSLRVSCWAVCGRRLAVPTADVDSKALGDHGKTDRGMLDLFPFFSCQEYVSKKDEERKESHERRLTWPRRGCTAPASSKPGPRHCLSRRRLWFEVFFLFGCPQRRRDRRVYFVNCRYIDSAEYAYSQQERTSFDFSFY